MSSSPSANALPHSLDPRVITLERTVGWMLLVPFVLVLLAMATVIAASGGPDDGPLPGLASATLFGAWAAFSAGLALYTHRWPPLAYRYTSYRVDDHGIEIRRGVVFRRIINVPRSRVQHTDVSQGPLERKFGLGTLVIFTAGTDHARVAVSGLDHSVALDIREHLLPGKSGDAV